MLIAVTLPYRQLLTQQIYVFHPARQALAGHYIELYFCNVQPDPMFGSIMDLQLLGNPTGFRSGKYLVQGREGMGIQVVHDKYDLIPARIADIHKILDLFSPVNCCTVFSHAYMAHSAQRLHKYKNATGTIPNIFTVNFLSIPWTHRQRLSALPVQLIWLFIHANYGNCRIIWHFINIQDILHAGYEFCIFFERDTPVGIFVRSKLVFFSAWHMASFPMGTSSSTRAFSSKSRSVQRECPSGTGPQSI